MSHPLVHPPQTSNDLLADRRFAWANALAADGELAAAVDLFEQVVDRVPDWAPGWASLAGALHRLSSPNELAVWRRVLALDPADHFGAALHIARLEGSVPGGMPAAYVAALFDGYASRFEHHLVEDLKYCGPRLVTAALDRLAPRRTFARALDLGCGTGLMARAVSARAVEIDGIDLSRRMVERAASTGLYQHVQTGPLESALAGPSAYDLILAADVLAYVGDLAAVMSGVARSLVPGGLFVFTLQSSVTEPGDGGIELGQDLRFAHSRHYVERIVASAKLNLLGLDDGQVRTERGTPVPGWVGTAALAS